MVNGSDRCTLKPKLSLEKGAREIKAEKIGLAMGERGEEGMLANEM